MSATPAVRSQKKRAPRAEAVLTFPAVAEDPSLNFSDLQSICESIPHVVWMAGPDGKTEYFNRQGVNYTGQPASANYGWGWVALVHPDDVDRALSAWESAISTATPYHFDFRIRRFDGEYRWHAARGLPILDDQGRVVRWLGTATDIEEAKRSEAKLQRAQRETAEALALLETLLSGAPVGLGFVDRDFRVVRLNDTLAAINGSTVAEQVGKTVAAVVPQLWPQLEPLFRQVLDSGESVLDVEVDGLSAADPTRTHHWLASYYPVSSNDDVVGIGIVVMDITERKNSEKERRQLSAIVGGSGDAICSVTTEGTITSWNGAAERLFGYTATEMIGQPVSVIAPADRVAEQAEMRVRLLAGGPPERFETLRSRKDGSLVEVLISASTVFDETGTVVGLSLIAYDITVRREAQRGLEGSQRRLAEAQRVAHLGSFEHDLVTGEMAWSDELYRILGLDPALEPSRDLVVSMVHPDDLSALAEEWTNATERGVPYDLVYRIIRAGSEERNVHARALPVVADNGTVVKLVGTLMDDTDRIEADRLTRAAERRFEIGFEQAGIGAAIVDLNGLPVRVNHAVCALLARPEDLLVGRPWAEYAHPDDLPLPQLAVTRRAAGYDTSADERRYLRPDGTVVWASCHTTLARDEAGEPHFFFVQLQDITDRKRLEVELAHQALHDALTGLPNRALLTDRLVHGLAGSRRRGSHLGVIFLDIDHFKAVNDSVGHSGGDDVLRHTAGQIQATIRAGDTVARFGGDEFVIVCDDITAVETLGIAQRVVEALHEPTPSDSDTSVTASLGIVIADEGATPESLLRDADFAMYDAKRRGRDRIAFFDKALQAKAEQRSATAAALHRGLERQEFTVHYQPMVDLATGAMVSAEALLRWEHPDGCMVSPDDFIPLAEESGLVVSIGAWVLDQACQQLVQWQRSQPSMSIAVNLSVRQVLAPGISELIGEILTRTGVPPQSLCLELTETLFMEDIDYFGKALSSIKALGVRLSIDDFGTGYSSLSYLKRFPVDAVKVDRSFIEGLGTDPRASALVAAIIALADALNLEVTAEGVETHNQLAHLKRLGCGLAQGFHLARPMPAAALTRLVADSQRWQVD
jgi:diguanylate cyclase (GGDEF)-like protein/PAS domain S-box-containing protein